MKNRRLFAVLTVLMTLVLFSMTAYAADYTVNYAVTPAGAGNTSGIPATPDYGDPVTVTATANLGYSFQSWTSSDPGNTSSSATTSPTTTFQYTSPGVGPITITANFQQLLDRTITVNTNNASWGSASSSATNARGGETVTLSATPVANYRFVRWQASGVTFANPASATTSFTMVDANVAITAVFEELSVNAPYSISMSSNNFYWGGAGSQNSFAAAGKVISISATPYTSYKFSHWTSRPAGVTFTNRNSATTTFIMPANNVEIIANFVSAMTSTSSVPPVYRPNNYPSYNYPSYKYPSYNYPSYYNYYTPYYPSLPSSYYNSSSSINSSDSADNLQLVVNGNNRISAKVDGKTVELTTKQSENMTIVAPTETNFVGKNAVIIQKQTLDNPVRFRLPWLTVDVPQEEFQAADVSIEVSGIYEGEVYEAYDSVVASKRITGPWKISVENTSNTTPDGIIARMNLDKQYSAAALNVQQYHQNSGDFEALPASGWDIIKSGDVYYVRIKNLESGVFAVSNK